MELLGYLSAAFLLGLTSSGHCLLMCGPIQGAWLSSKRPQYVLLYNLGRFSSYILIGLLFYRAQGLLKLPLWTTQTSLLLGISMSMGALLYLFVEYFMPQSWTRPLVRLGGQAGKLPKLPKMLAMGMLNGFIPCGMVWMAAGLAAPSGNTAAVAFIMIAFGLGTQPALLGVSVLQRALGYLFNAGSGWRGQLRKLSIPLAMLLAGVVLVFRAYTVGQQLEKDGTANHPDKICAPIHSEQ